MKTNGIAKLANQIIALRSGRKGGTIFLAPNETLLPLDGCIIPNRLPQPLTYKSGSGHPAALIALFLPTSAGAHFMQSDPRALPPNELHITLAYLGKVADLSDRQILETRDLMRLISENHPPLTGHINGCGRFCNGDDDGEPFFIIPDLAALPNLREIVTGGLKSGGVESAKDHGFVPHITLTYLPHAKSNPFDSIEKTPVAFPAISLVLGDDRYDYPLTQGVPLLSKADLIELVTKHAPGKHSQKTHAGKRAKKGAGGKAATKPSVASITSGLPENLGFLEKKERTAISKKLAELSTDELTKAISANNKKLDNPKLSDPDRDLATDLKFRNTLIMSNMLEDAAKRKVKKLKREQAKAAKSDYGVLEDIADISALIEKIGARHAHHEIFQIQHIHDLTLDLGAECHPLTRRAGARHSHADQGLVQRMHDDCAGLGAECKAMPERDAVYSSQTLKDGEIIKAQSDAPNYQPASTPQRCANCRFFLGDPGRDWCDLFDFTADPDYVSDAWEPQRPNEIPGYVANKGALTEKDWENSTLSQRSGRDAVNNAIKDGTLKKASTKTCYRCGKRPGAEYHHVNGYSESKKLNVRPVCHYCHATLTNKAEANKSDLAALTEGILILRGSAGSGNFGHTGRPGKLGGSAGGGGLRRIGAKKKSSPAARKKAAKKFRTKQTQAKPKKKPAKPVAAKKPKAQAKPVPAKKPTTEKPDTKLKKANANLATAKEKRDTELKSIVDLERRQAKANANLRNKKDVLGALTTLDDVEAKLKGRSSKKIMDQYSKDTKADSEIVFAANLKEAKVARSEMKKQLQANTKSKAEAKKEVKQAETKALKAQNEFFKSKKQFGAGDPRTGEATDAMLSSLDDFKSAKANLSKVDDQSKKQMLDVLKVSNPASTKIAADSSKTTKAKRKEWQNTMDDVNKLVSADVAAPGHEVKFTTQGKKVRAHALPPGDEIVIRTDQQSRVIAHEVAHTIEMKNPRILQRAEEWRDNRTKGEKEQLLSKVTGNKNYRNDEKTKPDKFVNPYIGKPYKNATEVISMGLERMFDDPVKFAKDDADMFDFMYAVLRSG